MNKAAFISISDRWAKIVEREYPLIDSIGCGNGLSGVGMYFLHRYLDTGAKKDLENVKNVIELCVQKIEANPTACSLIDLTEFLYFLDICKNSLSWVIDISGIQQELFAVLRECATFLIEKGEYDPYVGGFFQAYYMLHGSFDKKFTDKCTKILKELTEHHTKTSASFHSGFRKEVLCYSITHGLAFYITYLCSAYDHNIQKRNCRFLLRRYTNFLMENRNSFDERQCFFHDYENETETSRLCLCYGDAGILLALLRSSRILRDTQLENETLVMLRRTIFRTGKEATGVHDEGLLYGSSGLYLYYMKVYSLTKLPEFRQAAEFWKTETFRGVFGRMQDFPNVGSVPDLTRHLSFQEGFTGAMTALHGTPDKQLNNLEFFFYMK